MSPRDLAFGALLGAAGLVFPVFFHLLHLGPVLMPMYWPLVCLPFFAGPRVSVAVAAAVPWLSALVSGMPPLVPPVAAVMSLELAAINGAMVGLRRLAPYLTARWVLAVGLLVGRGVTWGAWAVLARWVSLPAHLTGVAATLVGVPGVVAMVVLLPVVVQAAARAGLVRPEGSLNPVQRERLRLEFFDGVAAAGGCGGSVSDSETLGLRLEAFGVRAGERVLDLGCGTGELSAVLRERVGAEGRVVGVDASLGMVAAARRRHRQGGLWWVAARAQALPFRAGVFHRCFLFRVWPHLEEKTRVVEGVHAVLRHGGTVHVWHPHPRREVNRTHRKVGGAVAGDWLESSGRLGRLLARVGFVLGGAQDRPEFLVTASKP